MPSLTLAERIESAQAQNQCDFATAHKKLHADSRCAFIRINQDTEPLAVGLYAGAGSPFTQSFGLGFGASMEQESVQIQAVTALEDFFFSYGVPVNIELANVTPLSLTHLLGKRGYAVSEYSHVLGLDLSSLPENLSNPLHAYKLADSETEAAADAISAGFFEQNVGESEIPRDFRDLFIVKPAGTSTFGVKIDDEIAGAGGMTIMNGLAMLSGASTQIKFRNRGVQKSLVNARLSFARKAGCNIAVVSTAPGTVSQENMQKLGFRILYARTKFTLDLPQR